MAFLFGGSAPTVSIVDTHQAPAARAEIMAAAPSRVNGYTNHARQRMSERGITESQVEFCVFLTYADAELQADGTWKYRDPNGLVVIMNNNGWVITTWWS